MLVKSLKKERDVLKTQAIQKLIEAAKTEIPNLDHFETNIIDLISKFGAIGTPTLAQFLNLEEGITFKSLSRLKRDKKIDINEKFEWRLK
jgi:hypothetical protein